ncbi:hypothetical protein C5167_032965 [Papaver somniferum]|uniref:Uncharacterized protein n=1 Tax=Papaver somniferum TaxID=3469 RepID=A0A4Y7K923_PAPSO|nr:hypothetical protein C5167_032965 [Papaver somniferum]
MKRKIITDSLSYVFRYLKRLLYQKIIIKKLVIISCTLLQKSRVNNSHDPASSFVQTTEDPSDSRCVPSIFICKTRFRYHPDAFVFLMFGALVEKDN